MCSTLTEPKQVQEKLSLPHEEVTLFSRLTRQPRRRVQSVREADDWNTPVSIAADCRTPHRSIA